MWTNYSELFSPRSFDRSNRVSNFLSNHAARVVNRLINTPRMPGLSPFSPSCTSSGPKGSLAFFDFIIPSRSPKSEAKLTVVPLSDVAKMSDFRLDNLWTTYSVNCKSQAKIDSQFHIRHLGNFRSTHSATRGGTECAEQEQREETEAQGIKPPSDVLKGGLIPGQERRCASETTSQR